MVIKASKADLKREPVFTKLHEKYQSVDLLGSGTYGMVYKAVILKDGKNPEETGDPNREYVALKRTALDKGLMSHGVPDTALREMAILRDINHPNILKTLEFSCNLTRVYVVMELLDKDLKQYIRAKINEKKSISIDQIRHVTFKMLQGVAYLHANRILHRDLKPHNILVSKDLKEVKLSDFGLARTAHCESKTLTHEVITLWYRPPEILLGDCVYDKSVDIWSTGCILGELLNEKPIFDGESELDTLLKIFNRLGSPSENEWPENAMQTWASFPSFKHKGPGTFKEFYKRFSSMNEAKLAEDLLLRMLQLLPSKRLTAAECLYHPWFDTIRNTSGYEIYKKYTPPLTKLSRSRVNCKLEPTAVEQPRRRSSLGGRISVPEKRSLTDIFDSNHDKIPIWNPPVIDSDSEAEVYKLASKEGLGLGRKIIDSVLRSYSISDDGDEDLDNTEDELQKLRHKSRSMSVSEEELKDRTVLALCGIDADPLITKAYKEKQKEKEKEKENHRKRSKESSSRPYSVDKDDPSHYMATPNVNSERFQSGTPYYLSSSISDKQGDRYDAIKEADNQRNMYRTPAPDHIRNRQLEMHKKMDEEKRGLPQRKTSSGKVCGVKASMPPSPPTQASNNKGNADTVVEGLFTPATFGPSSVVATLTRRLSREFENVGSAISRGISGVFHNPGTPGRTSRASTGRVATTATAVSNLNQYRILIDVSAPSNGVVGTTTTTVSGNPPQRPKSDLNNKE